MSLMTRTALGAVAGGSLLFAAGLGLANAQPEPAGTEDGKIDVALGTITTIEDVDVTAAEQIAGLVCGDSVTNAQLSAVERGDAAEVTCTSTQGSQVITFTQADGDDAGFAPAEHTPSDEVAANEADEVPSAPSTGPAGAEHGGTDHGSR